MNLNLAYSKFSILDYMSLSGLEALFLHELSALKPGFIHLTDPDIDLILKGSG